MEKGKQGGFLIKHALDVSPGNSGSPIYNVDRKQVAAYKYKTKNMGSDKYNRIIIGIHTGTNVKEKYNYGTVITADIVAWMSA